MDKEQFQRTSEDFKRLEHFLLGKIDGLGHQVASLTNTAKTDHFEIGALRRRIGDLVLTIEELKDTLQTKQKRLDEVIGVSDELVAMVEQLKGERDELIKTIKEGVSDQDSIDRSTTTNLGPSC